MMRIRIQLPHVGVGAGGFPAGRPIGPVGRALSLIAGGVLLVAGLFFSVLVFSVLLVLGVIAGGWFWWRTRGLRRDLREQVAQMRRDASARPAGSGGAGGRGASPPGDVLEGDFIREAPSRPQPEPPPSEPRRG